MTVTEDRTSAEDRTAAQSQAITQGAAAPLRPAPDTFDDYPDPEIDVFNIAYATADDMCASIWKPSVSDVLYDVPDLRREATGSRLFNGAPTCIITTSAYMGAAAAVTLIDTEDPTQLQAVREDGDALRAACVERQSILNRIEYACLSDQSGATPGYVYYVPLDPNTRYILRATFAFGGPNADRELTESEILDLSIWLTGWVNGRN